MGNHGIHSAEVFGRRGASSDQAPLGGPAIEYVYQIGNPETVPIHPGSGLGRAGRAVKSDRILLQYILEMIGRIESATGDGRDPTSAITRQTHRSRRFIAQASRARRLDRG